ncbi:hypothetical protein CO641_04345 [Lysobacteraceae bacterium NML91-0213]|nr:hypothetical protein CO641_04345 [Xanthomonadaceae bacterium NML91-0213]
MNTRDRSPLDADERAIAAQLARHASAGAPTPSLDAAVLAAAHAAAAHGAAAPAPHGRPRATWSRRRRWPAITGVAASLALAAGIAWQLRPMPTSAPAQDEAASLPATALRTVSDARPEAVLAAPAAAPASAMPEAVPPAVPDAGRVDVEVSRPAPGFAQMEAATAIPDAGADDVAAKQPTDASSPRSGAPPPAAATPQRDAAAPVAADVPAAMPRAASPTAVGRQALRGAPMPFRDALDAIDAGSAVHGEEHAGFSDGELDDSPPATVDSPEVHRAWLQRIRELRDAGRSEDARASLAELQRRFPGLAVPDDLAALAEPPQ